MMRFFDAIAVKVKTKVVFFAAFVLLASSGCATYQTKVSIARDSMKHGELEKAVQELEPLATQEGKDQLVYMLDYATVLQKAGRYQESARFFDKAERVADIQDYHSLSKVTSSLLLSEEMIQYKGDDYEKVLINAVNAVNFLEMGDLDGALVEVRKLNNKLYRYKYEAKRDYEQNPFAFYLSALIWEADRKWDDAYIAFKNAYEVLPSYEPLKEDLIRSAIRAQRPDEAEKWQKKFPDVKVDPSWRDRSMGEIVLVFMQGWGPRKRPRPDSPRFPYLVPIPSETQSAKLIVNETREAQTNRIFDVQSIAIKTLNDDYARLVASRVAGIATKAVVADQIRQKDETLGAIAWIAMNVADRADLRQWSTLPQTFQIARIPVKAGRYKVKSIGLSANGAPTGEEMPEREIEVKPGRKTFVSWRSVR